MLAYREVARTRASVLEVGGSQRLSISTGGATEGEPQAALSTRIQEEFIGQAPPAAEEEKAILQYEASEPSRRQWWACVRLKGM
jgi:hypothetical protein